MASAHSQTGIRSFGDPSATAATSAMDTTGIHQIAGAVLGREHEERAKDQRHSDAEADLELGFGGGKGGEGKEDREGQVDRARLGIVEDAQADDERDRRGEPELKQRPAKRDQHDEHADRPGGGAPAGVRGGDEFVELGLAKATAARGFGFDGCGLLLVFVHHFMSPCAHSLRASLFVTVSSLWGRGASVRPHGSCKR